MAEVIEKPVNLREALGNGTPWSASLQMNDYCGAVDFSNVSSSTSRDKGIQCALTSNDSACQTTARALSCVLDNPTCSSDTSTSQKPRCFDTGTWTKKPEIAIEYLEDDDVRFYTGLPNKHVFYLLQDILCVRGAKSKRESKLRVEDELLLVTMKLRLGLELLDLAFRFKVAIPTASKIFSHWIIIMSQRLSFLCEWLSSELIESRSPHSFNYFRNMKAFVHCTQIECENPSSLQKQSQTYLGYTSGVIWKALVAISPFGTICFMSDLYESNTSDEEIVIRSKILDGFSTGDGLMAFEDFLINDLCLIQGIHLIVPPKKTKMQFEPQEVELARRITAVCNYVEHAKECFKHFKILQGVMPYSVSDIASDIFKVCAYLCNLLPPLKSRDQ